MTSTHTTFGSFGYKHIVRGLSKKAKVFVLLEAKPFLELIISLVAFMLSSKYQEHNYIPELIYCMNKMN